MDREEARRRLRGTWRFDVEHGRVWVREERLLQAIALVRREQDASAEGGRSQAVQAMTG